MRTVFGSILGVGLLSAVLLHAPASPGQTPDEQKAWEAQRAQALAEQKIRAEQLEKSRAARKANPMAWVATLDPMSSGGWEFRTVADDGSWASYATTHQMKRSGKTVTAWIRQEFAEPQLDPNGDSYLSVVQKVDYDCAKVKARPLLVIYYTANNIKGGAQTEEVDPKQAAWTPVVPGTLGEANLQWACSADKASSPK
jgi:hypothetical protein